MSLDRQTARQYSEHKKKSHFSFEDENIEPDKRQTFLCLAPENLSRSIQHMNQHQNRRQELVTRTSIESRDTDSSSGSKKTKKKKHHRSRSPHRGKRSPNSSPNRSRRSPRTSPDRERKSPNSSPSRTKKSSSGTKNEKGSPGGKSRHSHKDSESQRSSSHQSHKKGHRKRKKSGTRSQEEGFVPGEGEEERSKATCVVVVISSTIIIIAVLLVVLTLFFTPHIDDLSLYCCNNTEDLLSTLPKK